ncbi:MAG: YlxR family protein [Bacilli bacterium]|nr:YlxR family protein [Bacilli bacterium]
MKEKKIPLRKCVITNEQHPKSELIRVVRTPEKEVVIDLTGKVRGHGAYVCKDKKVIELAQKKKTLDRALEIAIPDEIYDELKKLV